MPRTITWLLVPAIVALLALAACGGDDDEAADTTTNETTTETTGEVATTSTTESTTTSTTTTTTTTTTSTTQSRPSTNRLASGSGCTPSSQSSLPDGTWFGFIEEAASDRVSFDLACWFTGDAAATAAEEDGEESPPPNDYYIRNANPLLRTLTVDPSTQVTWLPNPGDPASAEDVAYDAWLAQQPGRDFAPGVWLEVEGGVVTAIEEQYVP